MTSSRAGKVGIDIIISSAFGRKARSHIWKLSFEVGAGLTRNCSKRAQTKSEAGGALSR
jgi:hypothetical protein